jgi:hypothetical protein
MICTSWPLEPAAFFTQAWNSPSSSSGIAAHAADAPPRTSAPAAMTTAIFSSSCPQAEILIPAGLPARRVKCRTQMRAMWPSREIEVAAATIVQPAVRPTRCDPRRRDHRGERGRPPRPGCLRGHWQRHRRPDSFGMKRHSGLRQGAPPPGTAPGWSYTEGRIVWLPTGERS